MMCNYAYPTLFAKQMDRADVPLLSKSLFATGDLHED
jgi:hypothetical protein